jgi:ribokinase
VLLVGLEIPVDAAARAVERGSRAGMRVILNPAPVPSPPTLISSRILSFVDVLTPNRVEALALTGMDPYTDADPDWNVCADRLLQAGARAVVITLGADGCLVAASTSKVKVPAPRVQALDTVGAGDAFNGAIAVALAEKRPLPEAAIWATAGAALAVTQPGAQSALPFRSAIDALARTL